MMSVSDTGLEVAELESREIVVGNQSTEAVGILLRDEARPNQSSKWES